ncbi:MAG: arginine deiminase family protein, partial [Planctomycetota bacterium]
GADMQIEVNYEWGTLKEVVCGIPYLLIPDVLPKSVYNYAPTEGIKFMEANLGKTLQEADPALYERTAAQMDTVVAILEKHGVQVHRLKQIDEAELKYLDNLMPPSVIQFFPRDPMIVIGNRFIEAELFFPVRRRECFGYRPVLAERLASSNAQHVSMPVAPPMPQDADGGWGPGPFLEGGDTFLLGQDIYVGNTGNASNHAGIQWLQQYLGGDYRVHEIKLSKKFLHLDCCLALPREGLAIICREAFVDGIPEFLTDWELIDVSYEDAHERLGCNGLILDDKTMIMADSLPELAERVRKAGQEVIETPFDTVYQYGGAFRCWHHPLVREG